MSLFQKTAAVLTAGLMVLTAVVGSASVPDVSVHVSAASQGTYNDINYKNYGSYVEIVSYNGSPSAVTIPETIDGVKVTTIGDVCELFPQLRQHPIHRAEHRHPLLLQLHQPPDSCYPGWCDLYQCWLLCKLYQPEKRDHPRQRDAHQYRSIRLL